MERFMDWKSLEQQSERWRENEETLLELRRRLEREPSSVEGVFEEAEKNRRVFEHLLLVTHGVRAGRMELVEGFKPPLSLEWKKDLIMSGVFYEFYSGVLAVRAEFNRVLRIYRSQSPVVRLLPKQYSVPTADLYAGAAKKVLALFEELVAVFHEIASVSRDWRRSHELSAAEKKHARELEKWANERLATFVDAKTSLAKNERLRSAVAERARESGLSLWQQKLVELVTATPLAFAEREEGEPIRPGSGKKSVASRAVSEIEETATPERFKTGSQEVAAEDEALRQHEDAEAHRQYVDRLAEVANLPKRQRQAFTLCHKEGLSDTEIAEIMEVDETTVRRHRQEAIKKLQVAVSR